jgi:glycosyltransferase involved in cell wall biosynthesis
MNCCEERKIYSSVCIATYNGASYIEDQIRSILPQLSENDEIVVSDDCSQDSTIDIVKRINDKRIRIHVNRHNIGYVKNFENAIGKCRGEIIFLCDQDDIWPTNRKKLLADKLFESDKNIVVGNFLSFVNPNVSTLFMAPNSVSPKNDNHGFLNIIYMLTCRRIPYFGCCMAFSSKVTVGIIPFPSNTESHDQWIAIYGNVKNDIVHLDDPVLYRRIHDTNLTLCHRRPIVNRVITRLIWLKLCFVAWKRIRVI